MADLLGVNTGVAPGTTGITWPAPPLSPLTRHERFVTVGDASGTVTGPSWSFTTGRGLEGDFYPADGDVDGSDLAKLIADPGQLGIPAFAANFGKSACPLD